jgi:hypothetical protein
MCDAFERDAGLRKSCCITEKPGLEIVSNNLGEVNLDQPRTSGRGQLNVRQRYPARKYSRKMIIHRATEEFRFFWISRVRSLGVYSFSTEVNRSLEFYGSSFFQASVKVATAREDAEAMQFLHLIVNEIGAFFEWGR